MRTVDRPDDQIGLGPVKRPEPKPPEPQRVADGIMRGADGKLYTDRPPAPPIDSWFPGIFRMP